MADTITINITENVDDITINIVEAHDGLDGVQEAPIDGKQYVRKDGEWVELI